MKQLKHRIAIGKLENGEWKFDHYATEHELTYIKVHTDGKIYMRSVTNRWTQEGFIYDSAYCSTDSLFSGWQDVSDTHRIEWGIKTYDKHGNPLDIYDGDIFVDWNTGKDECSSDPVAFELFIHYDFLCADQFPMVEILGNVNENPELLDAANRVRGGVI